MQDDGLYAALLRRGMTRRSFLGFSAAMAAALALPPTFAPQLARAVEGAKRLPVIWVRGQSCGGDTEALLRSGEPTAVSLFLDVLAIEYQDSLLAVSGADAEQARTSAMQAYPNGYLAVVEGSIPDGASGAYCLIGGRPAADVIREVSAGALATIAVGSCACDGGAAAAGWNTTQAKGVKGLVGGGKYMALPGCPVNPVNLAAVLVHWIANGALPPADIAGRPLSAYGNLIHNQCERRPHFEFGEFATEWGDQGAQQGWCLYKLGCKGPETMGNCPTVKYGEKISWTVRAGHGCIGCMTPSFWNEMGPAYKRLPAPLFFLPGITADMLGGGLLAGIGGVASLHAVGMGVRFKRRRMIAAREKARVADGSPEAAPQASAADEPEANVTADVDAGAGGGAKPVAPAMAEGAEPALAPQLVALEAAERDAAAEAALDTATPEQPEER